MPFPVLCYPKGYLTMWAILGRRSPDQRALAWGQTLASNIKFMGNVNDPRKARLRRYAAKDGVGIAFLEKAEASASRFRKCRQAGEQSASARPRRPLARLLALFTQRHMVLKRRTLGSKDASRWGASLNEQKEDALAKLVGLQFVAEREWADAAVSGAISG